MRILSSLHTILLHILIAHRRKLYNTEKVKTASRPMVTVGPQSMVAAITFQCYGRGNKLSLLCYNG